MHEFQSEELKPLVPGTAVKNGIRKAFARQIACEFAELSLAVNSYVEQHAESVWTVKELERFRIFLHDILKDHGEIVTEQLQTQLKIAMKADRH